MKNAIPTTSSSRMTSTSSKLNNSNYFVNRMAKVWVTENSDTVLEVFVDVVVGRGVLQTLHKGI